MKISIICKASKQEGLGHLIRSLSLADYIHQYHPQIDIQLILITDLRLNSKLEGRTYNTIITEALSTDDLNPCDCMILDMLSLSDTLMQGIRAHTNKIVSISPIFDQMHNCDLLIHRTQYLNPAHTIDIDVISGLEYSIIRQDCKVIPTDVYTYQLQHDPFNIGICMGGTDPDNKTLALLQQLRHITEPAVFWVLLGESYHHRYNELIDVIRKDSYHEIILAKTNKSMWHILRNTSMAILTGGLTSYEAAYAGLPAINYFKDDSKSFLIKELEERKMCLGTTYDLDNIAASISSYITRKDHLQSVHAHCRKVFDRNPIENVMEALELS
ncbi:MAG: hypothetical protein HKN09_12960 [Saprospiraceae bacterium]|nr:hypothetical protein [Saprospiraceae bacterium]